MATGVDPNALELAAGAPKDENADAAGAPPNAAPVEAPKPCTCTSARSPIKGGERKRLIEEKVKAEREREREARNGSESRMVRYT